MRDEHDRAVARLAVQRVDEHLKPDRERERLVPLLAAERDELVLPPEPGDESESEPPPKSGGRTMKS